MARRCVRTSTPCCRIIIDLFKANPQRNLAEAYDAACWAHPEVRKQLVAAEQFRTPVAA